MFLPDNVPGQNAVYVPLASYTWKWNADASRPLGGNWTLTKGAAGLTTRPQDDPTHPQWSRFSPSPFGFVPKGP